MTEAAGCYAALRARAGPGRPRDPAKLDAILAAARASFLERGFHASTIEDIAQRAGVSKVTLYNRFGDKETLFEQVVRNELRRMTDVFDLSANGEHTLEQRLNLFGTSLLGFMLDPDHVAFDRLITGEIAQVPELAQRFFTAGPEQCRSKLADVLHEAADAGELSVADPSQAAEDLMALWKGLCDVQVKLGLMRDCTCETLGARAAHGTRVFLRAYAKDHEGG